MKALETPNGSTTCLSDSQNFMRKILPQPAESAQRWEAGQKPLCSGQRKLPTPVGSGGAERRQNGDGAVQVHLGVEADFRPATKAHPAFVVDDLDALAAAVTAAGHALRWDDELPGVRRCHVSDPFGNRIELIQA